MAKRLEAAALKDLAGTGWTIEIHDSDFAGTVDEFEVAAGSLQLKYEGNNSKTYTPITPSTLSFRFIVQDATHEAFITDLVSSPENEFTVKLLKGSNLYWAGRILVDQVSFDDQYYPYSFEMRAVCGLSMLKDVEYYDSGTAYEGFATILEHVQNVLGKIGTDALWGVADDYLITHINWFEDHHDTTSQIDPWLYTRVNHEAFYKDEDGEREFMSCWEVLDNIFTTFGANVRLSEGAWHVHQISEYANSTQPRISYYKSGLQKAVNAGTSYDVTVDQTRTSDSGSGRWRTSGAFTFTKQLREVKLTYSNEIPLNLIGTHTWNHVTGSDEFCTGTVSAGAGDVALRFVGNLNITMDIELSSMLLHAHQFAFKIKVGSYYLKRTTLDWGFGNISAVMSGYEWTTDESVAEYWTDLITPDGEPTTNGHDNYYNLNIPIDFTTPPLIANGDVCIDFYRIETYNYLTENPVDYSALNMTYTLTNNSLVATNGDEGGISTQNTVYTAPNPDTNENTRIERYKTMIGDGPTAAYPGHLEVSDTSTWELSADWREADTGTAYELGDLFVLLLMAIQRKPRKVYNGDIIGQAIPSGVSAPDAHDRVEIQSGEFYYLLSGTLSIDEWRWSGSWLLVDVEKTGVTPNTIVDVPSDVPFIGGGNGGGGGGTPVINDVPFQGVQLQQSGQFLSGYQAAGQVDYLPIAGSQVMAGQVNEGDLVQVINPATGSQFTFTAAADTTTNGGGIAAFTFFPNSVPSNSIINIYQPQTVDGELNTADTVQQVFEEDTTNLTDPAYLAHTIGELYTDVDAGDGSTAGFTIDSTGAKQFSSDTATPTAWMRSDDEWFNLKAEVFQDQSSELTKEQGLFYVYKGTYPVIADTVATRPIKPVVKTFQCVPYDTNITTGALDPFLPVGTEWSGYRLGRYKIVCQSYGSGSGNNTLQIFKNGVLQISAGFTIPLWTNISVPISMSLLDYFHFEVSSTRSTPPKGLVVEIEIIV